MRDRAVDGDVAGGRAVEHLAPVRVVRADVTITGDAELAARPLDAVNVV